MDVRIQSKKTKTRLEMFGRKTKLKGQLYNTQQLDIFKKKIYIYICIYIHKILRKSVETLGRH